MERNITSFALELLPRISRSQSMDGLSSQAAVAGYECALIAADHSPKFFPMLTYAAGTIRPAIAAMSLRFTASALRPTCSGVACWRSK